ncbi:MFS transporter [Euzebya tangerina]|uniref:MFS transporter n=1 Tax=Euzebya tangerina TaxID=591198 RepID=UPI00196B804F|nr:MFS transporter [Euzebya tangerina]
MSPVASVLLLAGVGLGAAFIRRQRRTPAPLIDLALFRAKRFRLALVVKSTAVFVLLGFTLYFAQYLQLVLGLGPAAAGVWTLPSSAAFVVGSTIVVHPLRRLAPGPALAITMSATALALLLVLGASPADGLGVIVAASVLLGLSVAPTVTIVTELIVASAPPEDTGAASGISETAAELGGALGLAVLGSIGAAVFRHRIVEIVPAALGQSGDTLGGALAAVAGPPGADAMIAGARAAFVNGMNIAMAFGAAVAVAAGLLAWRISPRADLEQAEAPSGPSSEEPSGREGGGGRDARAPRDGDPQVPADGLSREKCAHGIDDRRRLDPARRGDGSAGPHLGG